MPAPFPRHLRPPQTGAARSAALFALGLAAAACGDSPISTSPELASGGASAPLTAAPSTLDFSSPSAAPRTLTATVQYNGLITAGNSTCANVSPLSVPAVKPPGSSVYVATFTVSPIAVGQCTIVVADKKGNRVAVAVNVGAAGHMYFVAHQDDDLLFMNPDIQAAIAAGHYVTTVFLTAGACTGDTEYYLTREAGAMAAYARLAGVPNQWRATGRPIRELLLTGLPRVALVFFRLPASKSEAGNICDLASTNLRGLWASGGGSQPLALTSIDGAASYTREQLVDALLGLLQRWHPVDIGTLDGTGLFGGGEDPSGLNIAYPALEGRCYYYDHSDHFNSALFAGAARARYADAHDFTQYRGYNQANTAPNVTGAALTLKQAAFDAYGGSDATVGHGPPFSGLYDPWLLRRYDAVGTPASVQPLCQLLVPSQPPSAVASAGEPLEQQPVVQLRALDGHDLSIPGVTVEARVFPPGSPTASAIFSALTDASGRATFTDLAIVGAPGAYTLAFDVTGWVGFTFEVSVAGGP